MRKNKLLRLLALILITQLIGFLGSYPTISAIPTWYQSLNKPVFTPPNWVFAPVWTMLYILMATAAFLVWEKNGGKKEIQDALKFYFIQLFLNLFWSYIFFGFNAPLLAFFEIIILFITILITANKFFNIDKLAGFLLIPYIGWVGFAMILNLSIAILN